MFHNFRRCGIHTLDLQSLDKWTQKVMPLAQPMNCLIRHMLGEKKPSKILVLLRTTRTRVPVLAAEILSACILHSKDTPSNLDIIYYMEVYEKLRRLMYDLFCNTLMW